MHDFGIKLRYYLTELSAERINWENAERCINNELYDYLLNLGGWEHYTPEKVEGFPLIPMRKIDKGGDFISINSITRMRDGKCEI